ncbi:MAG: hypothetical protein JO061_15065 [Acidobacteriaceae bacterium]|nr:hypothetical protein [Acidobacteriaceae bacterium]
MNRVGMVIGLFIVIFIALLAWSTMHGPRYRVEVCMAYGARKACRTVSGKSEEAAMRGAVSNACADLVSGVTDTVNCEQSQPQSVKWLERPAQ